MTRSSHLVLVLALLGSTPLWAQPANDSTAAVSCKDLTTAKPHVGVAYRGLVKNEDYKLTAKVPAGLTGWSGVDASAPFHGFTIFLDANRHSCISFDVHLRIDDADAPTQPDGAAKLMLGSAKAWQTSSTVASGVANVKTAFSFDNGGDIDDGTVVLVAPATEMKRLRPIYNAFVKSLRFGSK